MTTQRGFTLIELMIVVAIIAILAAIAISQYQDYVAKAQVSEAFSIANGLKIKVSESYNQIGACPANGTNGIPLAASLTGKYIKKVDIGGVATSDGGCTLLMTFKASSVSKGLTNKAMTFTLIGVKSGPTRWECSSVIEPKYLPNTCH